MELRVSTALLALCLTVSAQDPPEFIAGDARKAEKAGDFVRAYLLYAEAAAQGPKNLRYWLRSQALQSRALTALGPHLSVGTDARPAAPVETDPLTPEDITESRQLQPPLRLQGQPGVRDINAKGDSKLVLEQAMKGFGIEVVFDAEYQPVANIKFQLERATFAETVAAVQASTSSFLVPISERMALAARDTQPKRQQLEHTMAISIPLPEPVSVQDAQELARSVQQMFEIQKFGVDSQRRIAVVRDRASKVIPAVALYQDLLRPKSEVMIEVDFLEVNRSKSREIGLQWQRSATLSYFAGPKGVTFQNLANVVRMGKLTSVLGIAISGIEALATMSDRDGRTLYNASMRTSEGTAVNFHLGDKYPVMTAGYFGNTTGTGQVYTPPPTFNFEDLGVVLKITPRVLEDNVVAMEVEAEYKVLTGEALNGIPVIASRKVTSAVRLQQGEAAIVAGLMRSNEARTLTGIAGLANIPALGALFRQDLKSEDNTEALLVIRPRLLRTPAHKYETRTLYTGTETKPHIPL